ncbi:methylmalonyl Co-A mutase-associated GTPase MeaB [Siminovitchia terrae]|uniref:methylmalonyl Co-A mutase-associated GTPase MeaB n=1 Tax=Siminovitchia terrae TaxID=1914933 RepID=UPI001BB40848|nr:methylmalonyl Co-A mutase-associated GTPase MeaB [Siminovitchia terrae]
MPDSVMWKWASGMGEDIQKKFIRRKPIEENVDGIIDGLLLKDRTMLSRAITLIESNADRHKKTAEEMLQHLLPLSGDSIRIGITGVPGAGKSTFIESFGLLLCNKGHRVAVLAVDPSSTLHGGSILGDKTRMERLANHPNAFIRPSPSGGALGGVHRKTRETIIACEAAGYDVLLIETVGVGQSEVMVRGMVDFFMLLVLTGAGDELQGMKKGIMELADAVIVNKADGRNLDLAKKTQREYKQILHFLQPATKGWTTPALTCSALYQEGIEQVWETVLRYMKMTKESGQFWESRKMQAKEWLYAQIKEQLERSFFGDDKVKSLAPEVEKKVMNEEMTVAKASGLLFDAFYEK